jgi:hypothetical protein
MLLGVFINMVLYGVHHQVIRYLEPLGLTAFVTDIDCPGSHLELACSTSLGNVTDEGVQSYHYYLTFKK